jgi:alpha-tubulin suppressor-like RCC1 family protein
LTNWGTIGTGEAFVTAVRTDGTWWSWGSTNFGRLGLNDNSSRSSPTQIGTDNDWDRAITTNGSLHSLAIKTNGELYGAGRGAQLAQNNTVNYSSPVQVGSNTWGNAFGANGTVYGVGE